MIRRYLREHLPLAGLLALFAGTFALVLSLYHLPTEPVAYASALCAVMGLIALIWGFVRYRRAHQARAHVLNAPHLLLDELPSPRTLSEADDQAIMQRLLHDIRTAQSDLAAYRQDSTDYFTAWVHQIKTPLSVMRLQLQSEDTPENRAMLAELFQMEQYVTMALSYARLGNPTKDLVLTRVPLDPVIRQAIRDFAPLLIRKKLRLQYEPTAESALTDSKWLLFILHQLLSNAVKYTRPRPRQHPRDQRPGDYRGGHGHRHCTGGCAARVREGIYRLQRARRAEIHRIGAVPRPSDRRNAPLPCVAVLSHWGGHERHH